MLITRSTLEPLSKQALSLKPGSLYEHYKGYKYEIISVARHSETLEEMVVYKALYGEQGIWVRPLTMFMETIEIKGKIQPRFKCYTP